MLRCKVKTPYKYRCVQWTGDNEAEIETFVGYAPEHHDAGVLIIQTMEGKRVMDNFLFVNDWLVWYEGPILQEHFNLSRLNVVSKHEFWLHYEVEGAESGS